MNEIYDQTGPSVKIHTLYFRRKNLHRFCGFSLNLQKFLLHQEDSMSKVYIIYIIYLNLFIINIAYHTKRFAQKIRRGIDYPGYTKNKNLSFIKVL